jgi:hypothetical protein
MKPGMLQIVMAGGWRIRVQRQQTEIGGPLIKLKLLVICFLLLVIAACAPQPDVSATDRDKGGHIQLRSGQLFDIVLADDYDKTGCQWRDEQGYDDAVVHLLGQRYEPGRKPPNGDGNGTDTERYRAQETGTVRIGLVESDNAGKVCRRYAVDVTVGQRSLADTIASGVKQVLFFVSPLVAFGLILGLIGLLVYRLSRRR